MIGNKYDRRKVTISLLLLLIISFCIQVSGDETRITEEPIRFRKFAGFLWFQQFLDELRNSSSKIDLPDPDNSSQTTTSTTSEPIVQVLGNEKMSMFRKFQGFLWFQELLDEIRGSPNNPWNQDLSPSDQQAVTGDPDETSVEITTSNPPHSNDPSPNQPITSEPSDPSTSSSQNDTTTDPPTTQSNDSSTLEATADQNSTTTNSTIEVTTPTTMVVIIVPVTSKPLNLLSVRDSCQEDSFSDCDGLCGIIDPNAEPEDSPVGYRILVGLTAMLLFLVAAILGYASCMISSTKKKFEAENAARLLELAAQRRQKIEENRRQRDEARRSNWKEEKTQNMPEDEVEEPPKNDVRERLLRLKEYKDRMDAMEKSDTRSSKFEQRGLLYIPGRMKLPEPDPNEDCAPEIILERVYYEPAGNEMFDIGTDVEIVGSDRSPSRKVAKPQGESKESATGSKEKKGGSKEGDDKDKTLELI